MRDAERRKDEFLAMLSHELRNPLAPILTAVELMQLSGDVATPHEREVIMRQAQHLLRLVDDLLDVSRVARGKVTLTKQRLELAAVVAKARRGDGAAARAAASPPACARPRRGLPVEADEVRLTQVVSNLLTNAAHYTRPGGRIDVTAARDGGEVRLNVIDNGVGIDPALLPHVFDMFVQGPRGFDRAEGGLGLGLSLVRTLTELHGGSVTAQSEGEGRGSMFTVRLPLSEPIRAPAKRPELRHAAARRRHRRAGPDRRRQPRRRGDGLHPPHPRRAPGGDRGGRRAGAGGGRRRFARTSRSSTSVCR